MTKTKQLFDLANLKLLAMALVLFSVMVACDDDEDPAPQGPEIISFEYGKGSDHSTDPVAYIGSDIHMEAEINAPAIVSSITIDIHGHDLTVGEGEEEWDFSKTFTDEKYRARNPEFHEHIDVPANAPAGEYHITITVVDELGNEVESEGHIEILSPVTVSKISIDESVVRGNDFHAEFMINAIHGVHHIIVDIHAHGIPVGDGEVEWDFEKEFEEGYHGKTEVEFHEHIDVPETAPAGEYHMKITIEDEEGNTHVMDSHIEVTAS
ncbi:protein containing PKD domain-containing protein [Marivirga lumbricoides]|uniref:Protein containing PKD domain-containing protein n=1 Tax=Marivirga lumbricoides TaxID=1046115 RepID=A0A2T4DSR3_9BACT|nr:protein containing PKD domain-containing protein [Marivirga lumbricoides]